MKRLKIAGLCITIMISLCACGGEKTAENIFADHASESIEALENTAEDTIEPETAAGAPSEAETEAAKEAPPENNPPAEDVGMLTLPGEGEFGMNPYYNEDEPAPEAPAPDFGPQITPDDGREPGEGDEPMENPRSEDGSELTETTLLEFAVQKHLYEYSDNGDVYATGNDYVITLDEHDAALAPKLSRRLDAFVKDFHNENMEILDGMAADAKEMFSEDLSIPCSREMEFIPLRADGRAFSFCIGIYDFYGGAHGLQYYKCVNLNTSTGQDITLSKVVKNIDALPDILMTELLKQNEDLVEYFEQCPGDRESLMGSYKTRLANDGAELYWGLTYDGIMVWYEDYAMGSYAAGSRSELVRFEDYPDIFTDTYKPRDKNGAGLKIENQMRKLPDVKEY